jgi:DNA helicase-2/ATP-dependent DNA helicase PcrA
MQNLLENLNKEQLSAVKHTAGPLLIVAGAGTGKTTVITRRIAYLIEQGLAKPDEVLALTFTDKAAGEMQERLDLLLPLGYHDMWISTFHSFCQRVLQQHGLDIGLPTDFKLVSDTGAWILIHNNLEKFNLDYYKPLGNPKKFISSLLKHFSRCKDELITPESYLKYSEGLALSLDSAESLVSPLMGSKNKSAKIKKGKPSKTIIASTTDLSAETLAKGEAISSKKKIASSSDVLLLAMTDNSEIERINEIANAFQVYEKLLLDNNYLDFSNLINFTLELFKKRPKILEFYQKKFKFVMVDEFQDTNFAQYQLVKMLSDNANSSQNLVVVGDDDQSIYKFRGASVSNILKFQNEYPKLKQITLVENYRSGQKILNLAYNFIQANNPERLEVKLKINKELKSQTKTESFIEVIEGKDLSDELNSIARKINALKKEKDSCTWNDFAILIRSNSAAEELLPILAQHSIPHTFVANTGLYKKPLIADLIAYLSVLNNFHDSLVLYRVLSFKNFGFSSQDLATLLTNSQKKTLSLYEMLTSAKTLRMVGQGSQKLIDAVLSVLNSHANLAKEKAANEIFVQVVEDLKLEKTLEAETLENAENRELLEQFYKKIETFVSENSDKSLHHFLHLLNLEAEAGDEGQIKFDPNLGPESLKVLTVHSAKGLEFEHVFIPNMVDQRFPTRARNDQIEIPTALIRDILPEGDFHIQEERRLFYVALTRAKNHLYLSWAKDYGGAKTKKPSVFLQETKLVPGEFKSLATGKVFFAPNKNKGVVYKNLPETFSFSALKCFENCPLQYKYQYYLKLPTPGSAFFSFGQTIHKVFELYLKDYQVRKGQSQQDMFAKVSKDAELGTYEHLVDLYQKSWIDEWYKDKKQKEEYRKRGKELLKLFYGYTKNHPPSPKYLEKSFCLPLGDYKFTGKIDRADLKNGGLEIIDYKTSEKIPKSSEKKDLDQLHVYQWAAEEFLGEKVTSLCYWYLQADKEHPFLTEEIAGKEEITELKQRLLETIELIVKTVKYDNFKELHKTVKEHRCDFGNLN